MASKTSYPQNLCKRLWETRETTDCHWVFPCFPRKSQSDKKKDGTMDDVTFRRIMGLTLYEKGMHVTLWEHKDDQTKEWFRIEVSPISNQNNILEMREIKGEGKALRAFISFFHSE